MNNFPTRKVSHFPRVYENLTLFRHGPDALFAMQKKHLRQTHDWLRASFSVRPSIFGEKGSCESQTQHFLPPFLFRCRFLNFSLFFCSRFLVPSYYVLSLFAFFRRRYYGAVDLNDPFRCIKLMCIVSQRNFYSEKPRGTPIVRSLLPGWTKRTVLCLYYFLPFRTLNRFYGSQALLVRVLALGCSWFVSHWFYFRPVSWKQWIAVISLRAIRPPIARRNGGTRKQRRLCENRASDFGYCTITYTTSSDIVKISEWADADSLLRVVLGIAVLKNGEIRRTITGHDAEAFANVLFPLLRQKEKHSLYVNKRCFFVKSWYWRKCSRTSSHTLTGYKKGR